MSLKALLTGELTLGLRIRTTLTQRSYAIVAESSTDEKIDLTSVDTQPKFKDDQDMRPDEVEAMRNKSRLRPEHRNMVKNQRPFEGTGPAVFHDTIKYKQKSMGRYGIEGSGIEPGLAWPTKESIAVMKEYERVAYPLGLQEAWAKIEADNHEKAESIKIREDTIASNIAKTGQWEKELIAKLAKKEATVLEAKERKERLMEEVRRHFGFKVDTKDEKFKEMLEQKEKEDKKRKKEAKKKERADKLMAKLMEGGSVSKEGSPGAQTPQTDDKSKPVTPPDLA